MDELPEFQRGILDSMRQPMEEHQVHIARNNGIVTYPANFMLVAAMNPCPCGYLGDGDKCRCTQNEISKYSGKISGPLLDRIDIPAVIAECGFLSNGAEAEQLKDEEYLKSLAFEIFSAIDDFVMECEWE